MFSVHEKHESVCRWFNPVPLSCVGKHTPASESSCFTKADSTSHLLSSSYQMEFELSNRGPCSADSVQRQPCMYTNLQWESYTECQPYSAFTSSQEVGGASYGTAELSQDIYPQYTCEVGMQSHCPGAGHVLYTEQEQSHSVILGQLTGSEAPPPFL